MIELFNYSEIVEKEGKRYLYDPQFLNSRKCQLEDLQATYKQIRETLERYEYPAGEVWVRAIADGGADALRQVMVDENDKEAKRMKVPAYMAKQWRKSVVEDAPGQLFREADELHRQIAVKADGLPIRPGDLTFNGGDLVVNVEAVVERIIPLAMCEITPQMDADAHTLREVVAQVRALQEGGLNALEVVKKFMGNWLAPSNYPAMEDLEVYAALQSRRHISREQIKIQSPEYYYLNGGE